MAIEWQGHDRGTGTVRVPPGAPVWTAVEPGPGGTEFYTEFGPFGTDAFWFCAWRRKMTAGEAVTSQVTVQLAIEGCALTPEVAKATCERLMECFQQITQDSPGILQTLHSAAT